MAKKAAKPPVVVGPIEKEIALYFGTNKVASYMSTIGLTGRYLDAQNERIAELTARVDVLEKRLQRSEAGE